MLDLAQRLSALASTDGVLSVLNSRLANHGQSLEEMCHIGLASLAKNEGVLAYHINGYSSLQESEQSVRSLDFESFLVSK